MIKKVLSLIFIVLFCYSVHAKTQYAYQINFTDKNGTLYSLSSPSSYLSPRALTRRATQGIAIDSTDLPVNRNYIDSVLALTGGILHESSKWLNFCVILDTDSISIHALIGKPYIKSVVSVGNYLSGLHNKRSHFSEPSTICYDTVLKTTDDAAYYNNTWIQTSLINGNYLDGKGFKGEGKLIAVLDAGFIGTDYQVGFDSLRNSGRLVDVHNFSYDTNFVYSWDDHGTCALSTMAGYIPNTFVGSAPLAQYALYVTEIEPTEFPLEIANLICGVERADSIGADILTCSLGYNTFDSLSFNFNFNTDFDGKTTIAAKAANIATAKGMLFVASAGNEGGGAWSMDLTPGDADSALTIGSVQSDRVIAGNSGYGPNAAGQVKPDVCAQGQPANVINQYGYVFSSGTSFSTPQIAGWAACLWESCPTATPYQIRSAIQHCADRFSNPDSHYGYGIANFMCSAQYLLSIKDADKPFKDNEFFNIMPNPVDDYFLVLIKSEEIKNVSFCLTDVSGKILLSFDRDFSTIKNRTLKIDTKNLSKGVYLLKASTNTMQKTMKVVKN